MSLRLPAFLLALLAVSLPTPQAVAQAADPLPSPEAREEAFGEVISVSLLAFRARVVDPAGVPISRLAPSDLTVRAGKKSIPVVSVDYVDQSVTPDEPRDTGTWVEVAGRRVHQASSRGQLFVVFVEADRKETRREPQLDPVAGRDRIPQSVRKLLTTFPPEVQVAVVAYDGARLWLAHDFGRDREAAWQAVVRAARGDLADPSEPEGALSMLPLLGQEGTAAAASSEKALSLTAAALSGLPGEKTVLYLATGHGHFGLPPRGMKISPELEDTLGALTRARATVFVLARRTSGNLLTRDALSLLSGSTGGTYSSYEDKEVTRLGRTLAGYHVITVDTEEMAKAEDETPVTVRLTGRKGTVLMAPLRILKAYM